MKFMWILVVFYISIKLGYIHVSAGVCGECRCIPDPIEPTFLLCEGLHVFDFPILPSSIKDKIEEIFIINTVILCLPSVSPGEFPKLGKFGERDNEFMDCVCLKRWIDIYQDTIFETSCQYDTTMITSTSYHSSQKTTPLKISTSETHPPSMDYSIVITTELPIISPNVTSPHNSTTITDTDTSTIISISLGVGGFITIFIIVISVVMSVYRAKKRTNQLRDMTFRNPIYRGCEYELREVMGGAIEEEEV